MDIAIFGGSFNPVHMGHYGIVQYLVRNKGFSKIIVVPTYQNPLKPILPVIPEPIRWQMLKQTFQGLESVEISKFELQSRRLSYSYETVQHFKQLYPANNLFLVLGEDTFTTFPQWAGIETILNLSKILVFPRPALRKPKISTPFFHGYSQRVTWLDLNVPNIYATQIRNYDSKNIVKNHCVHPDAFTIWKNYQQSIT